MNKLYYACTDIKGFLALAAILLGLATGLYFWMSNAADPMLHVLQERADSLEQYAQRAATASVQRDRGERNGLSSDARLFPFDPNHADSSALVRLGLSSRQVRNLLAYRRKGGRWHSPDDLARLYGLNHEDFLRLRPYVRIAPEDQRKTFAYNEENGAHHGVPVGDRPSYGAVEKMKEGETLDINSADSAQLNRVPGIGGYYARKIVAYRERMGGFVSVHQIGEVEGLPAGAERWFRMEEAPSLRKIRINHAGFKEIVRHPYFSYEQTKTIVNHVRRYGPIRSWRDLRLYKVFTETDFRKLTPYVSFD